MLNSSTTRILSTFDSEEFKRFEDFIKSPFFSKKSNVTKLFSVIKKYYPEFSSKELKSELIWGKIFPEKKYNYGIMKNLVHDLHKLSESFLQQIHFEQNKINRANMLLSEYLLRSLNTQFEKEAKLVKNLLNISKHDLMYYQDKLNFETLYYDYFYTKKINMDRFQSADEFNLSLLKFCFANFFDRNCTVLVPAGKLKIYCNTEIIDYVAEFFEKGPLSNDDEALIFYYKLNLARTKNDTELYYKLKSVIEKNYFRFTRQQQYDFYIGLINFCLPSFNIDPVLSKEMFEIFKSMLAKKLYTSGVSTYMHYFLYVGISESALFCKDYDWAKKFIEDYKDKLDPEFKEVYYEKAMVSYYFATKDFAKASEILSKIKITSPADKLSIKKFQFMIYYEMNYVDELILLIDSSRHYISVDKNLSDDIKKKFLYFTQVMNQLITIKSAIGFDENIMYQIENFKKEIVSKELYSKVWLDEKIKDLELKINTK